MSVTVQMAVTAALVPGKLLDHSSDVQPVIACAYNYTRAAGVSWQANAAAPPYTIAAAVATPVEVPRLAVRAASRRSAASMRGSVGSSTQ